MEFRNGFQKKLTFLMKENGCSETTLAKKWGLQGKQSLGI